MAFTSSVATLHVIDITKRVRLVLKRYPLKFVEDDPKGSFSLVSYGVLHNEDSRAYIHWNIKEPRNVDMLSMYTKHMMDGMRNLKLGFKSLEDKGFI